MKESKEKIKAINTCGKRELSYRFFLLVAALLCILYLVLSALEYRNYSNLISATSKSDMTRGLIYIFSYLGFVVLVPILLIASTLLTGMSIFRKRIWESKKNCN